MNESELFEVGRTLGPPWLLDYPTTPTKAYETAWRAEKAGFTCRVLRGSKMRTRQAMWDEFGAALQLPDYFGENLDALNECLCDLSWLPGTAYLLLVANADQVLKDEPPVVRVQLTDLLDGVGMHWAAAADPRQPWDRRPLAFHVGLQVTSG